MILESIESTCGVENLCLVAILTVWPIWRQKLICTDAEIYKNKNY